MFNVNYKARKCSSPEGSGHPHTVGKVTKNYDFSHSFCVILCTFAAQFPVKHSFYLSLPFIFCSTILLHNILSVILQCSKVHEEYKISIIANEVPSAK